MIHQPTSENDEEEIEQPTARYKKRKRKTSILNGKEFRQFLAALKSIHKPSALIAQILWFLNNSLVDGGGYLTLQEVIRLTVDDVAPHDEEPNWVRFCRSSNKKSSMIVHYLPDYLWKELCKQAKPNSWYVFSNQMGGPLLAMQIEHYFAQADRKAKLKVHRRQYDLWEKKRRDALNSKDAEKLLLELPPAPIAPLQPYMICEEPSYEGLVELFNIGQPTAGIFSDDGARLVGGYAFSEDNKLKTAAGLSSIWDGSEITRVRKGDGCFTLRGKRLSVHLMLQEVALQRLVQGGVLEKQGLLARFLLIQPEQLAGKRKFVHEDPSKHPAVIAFDQMIGNLLDRRLPIDENSPQKNELTPKTLKCGPEAQAIWVDYYHEVEFQEGTEGKYSTIRSFASKSGEQAFRIAAVLTTVEDPNAAEISVEHMRRGVILARYFFK